MTSVRVRVVRGLVSGLLHEAVIVALSFGAMLVLVRLLTPADYGRAAAVTGVLALVRAFSGALFVEHALQHDKETEPDWTTYFSIAGLVQLSLFGVTNVGALLARTWDATSGMAPLLHIASIGLILDWPSQVATVKLRRELRFERLKLLSALALALNLTSTMVLAWLGLGAAAVVIGGNVLAAVPMTISFLFVERWRPRGRWLMFPRATDARPILEFARRQIGAGLVHALRSAAESMVLTRTFGVATFGLLNRALALFQSTVGRLAFVLLDTAYPMLPMERNNRSRYAYRAARYLEAALILSVPGAAFIAVEGAHVSRVLYGSAWVAADPYLAPAAIALAAATLATAAGYVVMGAGDVGKSVRLEALVAAGGIVALAAPLLGGSSIDYMWALAVTQVAASVIAFVVAAPLADREWSRRGLWPAVAATAVGTLSILTLRSSIAPSGAAGLVITALAYAAVVASVLALTARTVMLEVLQTQKVFAWKPDVIAEAGAKAKA